MEEEITLVLASRTCNFVTSTGPAQLVGQLFLIFMIYGEEEAIAVAQLYICARFGLINSTTNNTFQLEA